MSSQKIASYNISRSLLVFCGFCGYLIQILAKGIGIAAAPSRWLNCASQGNEDEIERPSHLTTPSWQTLAWQKTNNEVQPH